MDNRGAHLHASLADIAAVFAFALASRLALIAVEPIIFGVDTILRLANPHRIATGHQLPLLQAILSLLARYTHHPWAVRCTLSIIGAIAAVGLYLLARHFAGRTAALSAALLFAVHPFLLSLSTVPFQETLMLAGLLFAFHFALNGQPMAASLALAAACFTRYEAWAACPALIFLQAEDARPRDALKACLLYSWTPLVWLAWQHGLTAPSGFVVDSNITPARLYRYLYLAWITVKFTQLPALLLGCAGFWLACRNAALRRPMRPLALFLAFVLVAIPFSAHGVMPDPDRFVTSREAAIPMAAVLLLSAVALDHWQRFSRWLTLAGLVWGLAGSYIYLHSESAKPDLQLSYSLARYLDRAVAPSEAALILAPAAPREPIQQYLDSARRAGGESALEAARQELDGIRQEPLEFLRTLVHSRLDRGQLVSIPAIPFWRDPILPRDFPPTGDIAWLAIWRGYQAIGDDEYQYVRALRPSFVRAGTLTRGGLRIDIYRRSLR